MKTQGEKLSREELLSVINRFSAEPPRNAGLEISLQKKELLFKHFKSLPCDALGRRNDRLHSSQLSFGIKG